MRNINTLVKIAPLMIIFSFTHAQTTGGKTDISILPFAGPNMSDVVVDSQMTITRSNNDTSTLDLYVYCFGTNLRSVPNPVSPLSTIEASIEYQNKDGTYKTLKVEFPAGPAMIAGGGAGLPNENPLSGKTSSYDSTGAKTTEVFDAHMSGNLVRVALKNTKTIGVNVLSTGVDFAKLDAINKKSTLFKSIRFWQTMPADSTPKQFMGTTGPLTAAITWYFAENGKKATVYAGFPGENKYCGGFFSPLVFKFKSGDPVVNKTSHFPLFAKDPITAKVKQKISWPDFKDEVYFLAYDGNENGKIDYGSELFGDVNGYTNGFENLKAFDENNDGVIDEKDKIFSKLVLWRDTNNDGISTKKEVIPLSKKGITSISLQYTNELRALSDSANIVGPGEFEYKGKNGEKKKGIVWDIFLKAVP